MGDEIKTIASCGWCGNKTSKELTKRIDGIAVIKCSNCGLIYVDKFSQDIIDGYSDPSYFTSLDNHKKTGYQENYELSTPLSLYWENCLLSELIQNKCTNILEVGCATGCLGEMLSQNDMFRYEGIDISDYAVNIAQIKGLKTTCTTLDQMANTNKYDVIISSETLEHIENLASFARDIKKRLKGKGTFIYFVPSINEGELVKLGTSYGPLHSSLEHINYFTLDFLRNQLGQYFRQMHVSVSEFRSGDWSSVVGVFTEDPEVFQRSEDIFSTLNNDALVGVKDHWDDNGIYNLGIIASKFSKFNLARQCIKTLSGVSDTLSNKLSAFYNFHYGKPRESNKKLLSYLQNNLPEPLTLSLLYQNESLISSQYKTEVANLKKRIEYLNISYEQLNDLKNSRYFDYLMRIRQNILNKRIAKHER